MVAKNNIRISKRTVDGLAPREKPYKTFDDTIKGFGVRTTPSGSKFFFLEYRPGAGGRSAPHKSLPLGRFGEITPEQAPSEGAGCRGAYPHGRMTLKPRKPANVPR